MVGQNKKWAKSDKGLDQILDIKKSQLQYIFNNWLEVPSWHYSKSNEQIFMKLLYGYSLVKGKSDQILVKIQITFWIHKIMNFQKNYMAEVCSLQEVSRHYNYYDCTHLKFHSHILCGIVHQFLTATFCHPLFFLHHTQRFWKYTVTTLRYSENTQSPHSDILKIHSHHTQSFWKYTVTTLRDSENTQSPYSEILKIHSRISTVWNFFCPNIYFLIHFHSLKTYIFILIINKLKLKVSPWYTPTPPDHCPYQVSSFYTLWNQRNSLTRF